MNSSSSLSSAFESKELMALGRLNDVLGLGPGSIVRVCQVDG